MTVIAFRPRAPAVPDRPAGAPAPGLGTPVPVVGTFRSPSGRMGRMEGSLRVQRLVIVPQGVFVTGVLAGQLRDVDGSLVGVDSRRATAAADLVREDDGYAPVVRPFELDLMGLSVQLPPIRIDPLLAPPDPAPAHRPRRRDTSGPPAVPRP